MVAARHHAREAQTENPPQRTLLLFGLSPLHGLSSKGGNLPSGTFLHCDPDRLLLPVMSEYEMTSDELSEREVADAARHADS